MDCCRPATHCTAILALNVVEIDRDPLVRVRSDVDDPRGMALALSCGSRRFVKTKYERWLRASVISMPSTLSSERGNAAGIVDQHVETRTTIEDLIRQTPQVGERREVGDERLG